MTKPHFYWYVGLNWRLLIESRELSVLATVSNLQLNQNSDRGVVWQLI
jgi:hypothetical protein